MAERMTVSATWGSHLRRAESTGGFVSNVVSEERFMEPASLQPAPRPRSLDNSVGPLGRRVEKRRGNLDLIPLADVVLLELSGP